MKDQLVVHGDHIADAQQNADRLLGLSERLADSSVKTMAAEKGAARMIEVQKKARRRGHRTWPNRSSRSRR